MNTFNTRSHGRARLVLGLGLFALKVLASGGAATASTSLLLAPEFEDRTLVPEVEWLDDIDRAFELSDVQSRSVARRFETKKPALGFTRSRIWARFKLQGAASGSWLLKVNYSALDRLCVHWPRSSGYESSCTGLAVPFSTRQVPHHRFVFEVPDDLADDPVYLEAESEFPIDLPLQLVSWRTFAQQNRSELVALQFAFGALIALTIYNLFLWFGTSNPAFAFYSVHIAAIAMAFLGFEGLGEEYFWPETPSLRVTPLISLAIAMTAGALFSRSFLLPRPRLQRFSRLLLVPVVLSLISLALMTVSVYASVIALGVTVLSYVGSVLAVGVSRVRSGFRPARFFLGAQFVFLVGLPASLAVEAGLLPLNLENNVLWRTGAVAGALLLSLALADRLRELREEREGLVGELKSRTEDLEQFARSASHDLKSPLVTIRGFLGLLRRDATSGNSEKMQHDIERISTAALRMKALLDRLSELSLVDRNVDRTQPVALQEVVTEALDQLAGSIVAKRVTVEVDPTLPVVRGDRTQLFQIYQNLIENAVKFMGSESEPRIEIACRREGGEMVHFVRDNGVGIDSGFHETVFDLFSQLSAKGDGTGYGLTLVRRLVELHGGRVWVESDGLGKGSTVCFTLY